MKAIAAAALAGIALAPTPSLAADLFGTAPPPMSFPADDRPDGRGRLELVFARRHRRRPRSGRRPSRWRPFPRRRKASGFCPSTARSDRRATSAKIFPAISASAIASTTICAARRLTNIASARRATTSIRSFARKPLRCTRATDWVCIPNRRDLQRQSQPSAAQFDGAGERLPRPGQLLGRHALCRRRRRFECEHDERDRRLHRDRRRGFVRRRSRHDRRPPHRSGSIRRPARRSRRNPMSRSPTKSGTARSTARNTPWPGR